MRLKSLALLPLVLLLASAGCFETAFVLGKVEDAKVDAALLGDWNFDSLGENANDKATLRVARLDDHQYTLDWTTHADGKVMRMIGFVTEVKGAKFVHAAPLDEHGKPSAKHYLIRFDLDGNDALAISNLDPEFFKGRSIDSDDTLRALIEAHLDDQAMYVTDALLGKRTRN